MPKVFVSYAHVSPDREFAAQLSKLLEANGLTIFEDPKIPIGQDWSEQIDVQLGACEFFVVLLSSNSLESARVRREIALAHKLRTERKLNILPVHLSLGKELPYEVGAYLDRLQYAVWQPGESFEAVCYSIADTIVTSTSLLTLTGPVFQRRPDAEVAPRPGGYPDGYNFDEAELERITGALIQYLGPVARAVVERATKRAANWRQLYEMLAAEVAGDKEREQFLATRTRSRV